MKQAQGRHGLFKTSALASALLACLPAWAETDADGSVSVELTEVTVTAQAENASTEHSGSYASKTVSIGKGQQSRKETPSSVSVVTRQRLEDQNLSSVSDALKQVTGITVQRFDGAGNFNNYYSRGYQIDAIQLDGINFGNTGNVVEFDTAMYDRIEVLRGPAGLFQGSGEPSGAINLARKRALADTQVGAAALVGSWNSYRVEGDVTGALTEDRRLRGRLVAAYDDRESYQDVVGSQKQMVYGTLEYDLTEATTLATGITWQKIKAVIDQGMPAYANGALLNVPRSTFIGANWNTQDLESTDLFAEVEHRLDGGGLLKFAAHKLDRYMLYKVARSNSAVTAAGNTNLQTGIYSPDRTNWSADVYADLPFTVGGLQQNVIVGADYRTQDDANLSTAFANTAVMNVYAPNHAVPEPVWTNTSRGGTEVTQYGTYGQLRLKPLSWATLVGGGRLSWWQSDTFNTTFATNVTTRSHAEQDAEFTPYAALIFDVLPEVSVYTSYADVFQPQSQITSNNEQIDPRTGKQIEAGIKGELLGGRLLPQFAVFRINDENRAIDDPNSSNVNHYIPGGEVESSGYEVEITGELLPGWEISTGYAYVKTEYLRAPTATQNGDVFSTFTPKNNFNLWTRYRFQDGPLSKLSIGGGARSVSSFYAQGTGVKFVSAGYTIYSLQLAYDISEHIDVSLTGNNLLDEEYYEKVSGTTRQNFYGEPRNAMLAVRLRY
ncbi:MAG TPA: TonB-dependent siderophore receptor [Moraxellaceae bacterium]